MRSIRSRAVRIGLTAAVLFLTAPAPAQARHNFSMLKVNPSRANAGDEVTVSGFSYPIGTKVLIRFNGLDGPVLTELDPDPNQDIRGTVVIPADTAAGRYVLFAVQYDASGKPNRIPGRAALTVQHAGAPAPAAPTGLEVDGRPVDLARSSGAGLGELILVAALAMGVASVLTWFLVRVGGAAKPARTMAGAAQ